MQIVRVYSGNDGESHFQDLNTDQLAEIVSRVGNGPARLIRGASPSFNDFHPAPRRQYVVHMSGIAEFETADGSKRRLVPGDVLIAEDVTGHGHTARSIGHELRVRLHISLAD